MKSGFKFKEKALLSSLFAVVCFNAVAANAAATAGTTASADNPGDSAPNIMAVTQSLVPNHEIGIWVMKGVRWLMDLLGLDHEGSIEQIVYTVLVLAVALGIGMGLRYMVLWSARRVMRLSHRFSDNEYLWQRTLGRCSHVIPPIVFLCLVPFAFTHNHSMLTWIMRIVGVYGLVTFGLAICSILEFAWTRFDEKENTENHPLKGVLNVCKGLVWIIIFIVSVSILIDKSPMTLLAGLGAFAAALMLIFKDSILGLVAGIQLSNNDMLRVGDWIVVPSTIANGTVMDVTLSVVKVQNWDNTMVMLPPYTLISTSFQNWRNMSVVGARRINYNLYIDYNSVRTIDDETVKSLTDAYPVMKEYVEQLQQAKSQQTIVKDALYRQVYNDTHGPNGTIDTNLGLFRAYACCYLIAHPLINTETQDMLVSMGTPQSYGITLNIYCFSSQTSWGQYEAIQSEIIENLCIVAPHFGLKIFNEPDANVYRLEANGTQTVESIMAQTPPPAASANNMARGAAVSDATAAPTTTKA